jgi:hypothetical protein
MSMVEKKIAIVTIIGLLTITMTGKTMAQSNLTEYDNKYFSMAYPSGWTVNDTGFGDLIYATNHLTVISTNKLF